MFSLNLCTERSLTDSDDTRCRINTIWPPEDEQDIARNMWRIVINVLKICASNWSLAKVNIQEIISPWLLRTSVKITRMYTVIDYLILIVVPCCMLFQSLLYCSNSCTSLHFKTLKSHTKALKICLYMFRSPLKPSSGGPWPYFARLLNWNVDLHLL